MTQTSRRALWKTAAVLLAAGLLPTLSACVQPVEREAMVAAPAVTPTAMDPALIGAVALGEVTGGTDSDPIWASEIGAPAFRDALTQSLASRQLLAAGPADARYMLTAHIAEISQPMLGIDMTVGTRVNYTLSDIATGQQPFAESISSEATASMGDALNGDDRRRLAAEGAVSNNISQMLERLASVRIP